jgi:hypothetical protein
MPTATTVACWINAISCNLALPPGASFGLRPLCPPDDAAPVAFSLPATFAFPPPAFPLPRRLSPRCQMSRPITRRLRLTLPAGLSCTLRHLLPGAPSSQRSPSPNARDAVRVARLGPAHFTLHDSASLARGNGASQHCPPAQHRGSARNGAPWLSRSFALRHTRAPVSFSHRQLRARCPPRILKPWRFGLLLCCRSGGPDPLRRVFRNAFLRLR